LSLNDFKTYQLDVTMIERIYQLNKKVKKLIDHLRDESCSSEQYDALRVAYGWMDFHETRLLVATLPKGTMNENSAGFALNDIIRAIDKIHEVYETEKYMNIRDEAESLEVAIKLIKN
jgi:type IV pilus biogenesis protein CpaD/CtpE